MGKCRRNCNGAFRRIYLHRVARTKTQRTASYGTEITCLEIVARDDSMADLEEKRRGPGNQIELCN